MIALEWTFWVLLGLIVYTYVGYGVLLMILVKAKRRLFGQQTLAEVSDEQLPEVTLVIPAYNEADFIREKAENSLQLDYPKNKLNILFVTDGSDDGTPDILQQIEGIAVSHQPERKGKIAAMNRIMKEIRTSIVIFSDANTTLNKEALRNIVKHYQNPKVGAVAGEKRINSAKADAASGSGEGFYWKYESKLKQWDAELYSIVGAAGELFSVRTELHEEVPADTLLDDFMISLRIAEHGYRVAYAPDAYALEAPSADVREEMKRKVRIACGGFQSIVRLPGLWNVFKHGTLTFQYVSHRVLRWTVTPLALVLVLPLNMVLAGTGNPLYVGLLVAQLAFHLLALGGMLAQRVAIKWKIFFIPYYFNMMNHSVYLGFMRYIKGNQSVLWKKARRAA